jgi:hypothetical protein
MEKILEKAAENYGWRIKKNTFSDAVKANELAESAQQDFIKGAEWQAKSMYSKEEVIELLEYVRENFYDIGRKWHSEHDTDYTSKELLEQFKKK